MRRRRRDGAEGGAPDGDEARGEVAPVPPRRLRQHLRRHQRRAHAEEAGVEARVGGGAHVLDGGEDGGHASVRGARGERRRLVGRGRMRVGGMVAARIEADRGEVLLVLGNECLADLNTIRKSHS